MSNNEIEYNDPEQFNRYINTYQEYVDMYVDTVMSGLLSDGIIDEDDTKTLKRYFSNPDEYQKEIENLAQYHYIRTAEVHILFELVESLPTLNYKIEAFDRGIGFEKHLIKCEKSLYKVNHKRLTRDVLKQEITAGTLIGIWLGNPKKGKLFPYIFDDLDYVFPSGRRDGEIQVVVDMQWFAEMDDYRREQEIQNLSPYVKKSDFNSYMDNSDNKNKRYKRLPQERTFALRTHTLKRNQKLGTSWATTGLFDVYHKKKLRDLEKSVANKIINAFAILTIGNEKDSEHSSMKLPTPLKQKIHHRTREALEKSQGNGITLVGLPEFAKLNFPEIKGGDSLKSDKFDSINSDIQSGFGVSGAVMSGTGGNFASAKINLEILYKRIGVLLEDLENEVYRKYFNLILPQNQEDNFMLVYDKMPPLTTKEKVDILMKLHQQEGFALKPIVDHLEGVDFNTYVQQSIYEQEELNLPEKIRPYKSSHTSTDNDDGGRPQVEDIQSEGTAKTKDNDGNNTPD